MMIIMTMTGDKQAAGCRHLEQVGHKPLVDPQVVIIVMRMISYDDYDDHDEMVVITLLRNNDYIYDYKVLGPFGPA